MSVRVFVVMLMETPPAQLGAAVLASMEAVNCLRIGENPSYFGCAHLYFELAIQRSFRRSAASVCGQSGAHT
jgi:hypothetical protein